MTTPGTGRQGGFLRLSLPSSHLDPLAFNSLKWLPLAAAVVDVGVPLDAAGASLNPAALRCRAALLLSVLRWSEMAIIHFINIRHRRSSPLLIVNKEALSQPTPAAAASESTLDTFALSFLLFGPQMTLNTSDLVVNSLQFIVHVLAAAVAAESVWLLIYFFAKKNVNAT